MRIVYGAGLGILLCGCGPSGPPPRPNVLVITIDTLRADRIGTYGFGLAKTPNLDRLAAEGVRCDDAATTAPITLPAHSSIFTGLLPPAHGVRDNGAYALSAETVTLAERLNGAGFATAAFVSAVVLDSRYALDQGFDLYDDDLHDEDDPPMFMIRSRPADRTAEATVAWLDAWSPTEQDPNFFVWTHFFDPHQPNQHLQVGRDWMHPSSYDAEITRADAGVGQILATLEAKGILDDTIVVFTADHGESLGEHGEQTHALFVYDATVRVPLIWRYPRVLPASRPYPGPVSAIDHVPTLLTALGLPGGSETQGTDLWSAFQGEIEPIPHPQYAESLLSESGFGMAPLYTVRDAGKKHIRVPKPETYDLRADPAELTNLYGADPALDASLDATLQRLLDESASRALVADANPMDEETVGNLQALGYLASPAERAAVQGLDPKDGLALHEKLEKGRHLIQRNKFPQAEVVLRELLEATPKNVSARNTLALALIRQEREQDALAEYTQSLMDDPNQARIHHAIAQLQSRAGGDREAAMVHLRAAIDLTPEFVEAHVLMGVLHFQAGDDAAAQQAFDAAVKADPATPRTHRLYGDLLFKRGLFPEALARYEAAIALSPRQYDTLVQGGMTALRVGDHELARQWLEVARARRPLSHVPVYNLACVEASAGRNEEALVLLGSAIELGFRDPAFIEADDDLASLHDLPGWKPLLEKARAGQSVPRP